jgi:dephospho-CoA kinase|tara:strand:+ start:2311 stop:2898 length:588 start_codon:yes stop_codon:yes gene_type:complete
MKVIGLTGGIGSGKSCVLEIFKKIGISTYSADESAKKLISSDKKIIYSIKQLFGEDIYYENELNSKLVSKIVFKDKEKLKSLNSIIHPAVAKDFDNFCFKHRDESYIVKEAAIIFETKSENLFNKIIYVKAPKEIRIDRVMHRDNLSRDDVLNRIQNQINETSIIDKCDFIIDNINFTELEKKVLEIHNTLISLN